MKPKGFQVAKRKDFLLGREVFRTRTRLVKEEVGLASSQVLSAPERVWAPPPPQLHQPHVPSALDKDTRLLHARTGDLGTATVGALSGNGAEDRKEGGVMNGQSNTATLCDGRVAGVLSSSTGSSASPLCRSPRPPRVLLGKESRARG